MLTLASLDSLFAVDQLSVVSQRVQHDVVQMATGSAVTSVADNPADWAISNELGGQIGVLKQQIAGDLQDVNLLQILAGSVQQALSLVEHLQALAVSASNTASTPSQSAIWQSDFDHILSQLSHLDGTLALMGVPTASGTPLGGGGAASLTNIPLITSVSIPASIPNNAQAWGIIVSGQNFPSPTYDGQPEQAPVGNSTTYKGGYTDEFAVQVIEQPGETRTTYNLGWSAWYYSTTYGGDGIGSYYSSISPTVFAETINPFQYARYDPNPGDTIIVYVFPPSWVGSTANGVAVTFTYQAGSTYTFDSEQLVQIESSSYFLQINASVVGTVTFTGALSGSTASLPPSLNLGWGLGFVTVPDLSPAGLGLASLSVATPSLAQAALPSIQGALNALTSVQGSLGAALDALNTYWQQANQELLSLRASQSTLMAANLADVARRLARDRALERLTLQTLVSDLAQLNRVARTLLPL